MGKTVKIDKSSLLLIDIPIDDVINEMKSKHLRFGELFHSDDFTNNRISEIIDISKCGFTSQCIGDNSLFISCNNSKSGKILSDLLEKNPESVRFVPRVIITQSNNGISVKISTFDAIINNKELWESF